MVWSDDESRVTVGRGETLEEDILSVREGTDVRIEKFTVFCENNQGIDISGTLGAGRCGAARNAVRKCAERRG